MDGLERRHEVSASGPDGSRFAPELMYAAARLYYMDDATQAQIAEQLGTSRATVSRLLSEARRWGIVRIAVVGPPEPDGGQLARRAAEALGVHVHLSTFAVTSSVGAGLALPLSAVLADVGFRPGDVLLVSSGRTVFEVAQSELPELACVRVAPTVGGQDEPEAWYQTNEIVRMVAERISGTPVFLHAPALPGPQLHQRLLEDPSIRKVVQLWEAARCAILGIGAPPATRRSLPQFVPTHVVKNAVADVCSHFYDRNGREVTYPGAQRLVAIHLDLLRKIPVSIALAVGQEKVPGIIAGARAGYYNQLVTDPPTASALIAAIEHPASVAQPRSG